jgi:hypothetical protein
MRDLPLMALIEAHFRHRKFGPELINLLSLLSQLQNSTSEQTVRLFTYFILCYVEKLWSCQVST